MLIVAAVVIAVAFVASINAVIILVAVIIVASIDVAILLAATIDIAALFGIETLRKAAQVAHSCAGGAAGR